MGILDRRPVKAIVLWASVSIGRWFWSGGEGRGGLPFRGRYTDERPLVQVLELSRAKYGERE